MAAPKPGGFKMSLGGLKAKPGLKAVAAKNDAKPKRALLGDDEPEDTDKQQEISGWDAAEGGAVDVNGPKEKKGPLVIPSLPNRNWREEARKKQLARAPHTQQQNEGVVMEKENEVVYGLTVPTKPAEPQENGILEPSEPMEVDSQSNLTEAQRLEKAAFDSLLNGKSEDTSRIVPAITDEEALQNDLQDAPDEPSLDAYEATPIEGFGLAMLRGMGWKDSDGESARKNGSKAPKEVKRRPALLGIGAKEEAGKDFELGEFNSKARGKKGRKDATQGYNPVTLRNKKTGEVITEEELKAKLEGQELVGDAKPEKESRRRDDEGERGERRREGRDDRERNRRRDDDHDSERRRDRDRKDDRRRDKYSDEDDHRREKRHDRDRRSHRDARDRRDRSRSPRDDKRRDRYRSRSRDSKDRRDRRERSRSRDRRKDRDYDDRDDRKRRYTEDKSSRR